MGSSSERRDPSTNPTVGRLRELFQGGDKTDVWEKSWQSGITPWDLGKPTPIIDDLVKSGTLPNGRALVLGCGMVEILKDDWMEVLNTELKRRIKMAMVLKAAVVLAFMLA